MSQHESMCYSVIGLPFAPHDRYRLIASRNQRFIPFSFEVRIHASSSYLIGNRNNFTQRGTRPKHSRVAGECERNGGTVPDGFRYLGTVHWRNYERCRSRHHLRQQQHSDRFRERRARIYVGAGTSWPHGPNWSAGTCRSSGTAGCCWSNRPHRREGRHGSDWASRPHWADGSHGPDWSCRSSWAAWNAGTGWRARSYGPAGTCGANRRYWITRTGWSCGCPDRLRACDTRRT